MTLQVESWVGGGGASKSRSYLEGGGGGGGQLKKEKQPWWVTQFLNMAIHRIPPAPLYLINLWV